MTTITARVVADSVAASVPRLSTMQLRYPLIVHAELLTHRVFSRNARSSRAVPVQMMINEALSDPFVPLHWGAAQKGMQARAELDAPIRYQFNDSRGTAEGRKAVWLAGRDHAVDIARMFLDAGYHKQVANRVLAPYLHIDVLVSSVAWDNFFALRDHPDAEPHIRILAREMRRALSESEPRSLTNKGMSWHLPYVSDDEWSVHGPGICCKLSTARCARISYRPFDGNASIEAEIARHDALVGASPIHASPAEHQATPDFKTYDGGWEKPDLHGNLTGWRQYRKCIEYGRIIA